MTDHRRLLREIAVPRLTGSAAQERVRAALEHELRARGFDVARHSFRPSLLSLHAVGLVGGVTAWTGAAAVVFAGSEASPAAHVCLGALFLLLVLGTPLRRRVLEPIRRSPTGVNLIARRATAPRVWLTAHSDSKGQYFSMARRLALVSATCVGGVALLALSAAALAGVEVSSGWWTVAGLVALGGGPLMLNGVLRDSPGALDNGTGLLAVLALLDQLPPQSPVGVIFPDAEEWGLVGARELVQDRPELFRATSIVNFDGIDDHGPFLVFEHRAGPLGRAVAGALGVTPRRFLPVVVDGVAFARAPQLDACVTVMRGNAATMRIVHTRQDVAGRLTLDGVQRVAGTLARVLLLETARSAP